MSDKFYSDRTLSELKEAINQQMEIEFMLNNKLYLLEPIYDNEGINAVAWSLSTDNGNTAVKIKAVSPDEVLDVKINKQPLKDQWQNMNILFC